MHIRKMLPKDYDCVYNLWLKIPGMGLNTTDDSRAGILKYLKRNPNTCFVAETDNEIIGVIMSENAFWEKCGFAARNDLIYRNKNINDLIQIKTYS